MGGRIINNMLKKRVLVCVSVRASACVCFRSSTFALALSGSRCAAKYATFISLPCTALLPAQLPSH